MITLALAAALTGISAALAQAAEPAGPSHPGRAPASAAAVTYRDAVVLVSGFTTTTPFTTPDPSCDGEEGETWDPSDGVAAALKAAGHNVFTAPTTPGGDLTTAACSADAPATPGTKTTIDSEGGTFDNGRALSRLLNFLAEHYGVERVQLVGHSDGGLWSRSAITHSRRYSSLLDVRSLTTLGTPHTGSWVADFSLDVLGLSCSGLEDEQKGRCRQLKGVAKQALSASGRMAARELTNEYLNTWNVRQRLGSCPVAGVAGTALTVSSAEIGLGALSDYYTPFDGVVGEASALARSATDWNGHSIPAPDIPQFEDAGSFDVVHSAGITSLDSDPNLLNTAAVAERIVELVEAVPDSGPLCTTKKSGERTNRTARVHAPLFQLEGQNDKGRLPVPDEGDLAFVEGGLEVYCGSVELELFVFDQIASSMVDRIASPMFRSSTWDGISYAFADCDRKLKVKDADDGARADSGTAFLARSHPANDLKLKVRNRRVRIQVLGPKVRKLRVAARKHKRWKRLDLDRKGRGKVPSRSSGLVRMRVRANTKPRFERATIEIPIAI